MIYLHFFLLAVSFALLFKCADFFVSGSVGIAKILNVSRMIVGIVLVGLATTAPEFGVSVQAAFLGHPEIALGNAIGSVVCDDGVALALAALLSPVVIFVNCRLLKVVGIFLLSIDVGAYLLARNGTIGRFEGVLFIIILGLYYVFIVRSKNLHLEKTTPGQLKIVNLKPPPPSPKWPALKKPLLLFTGGIAGVIITSRLVIWASLHIARYFSISETVIGLTVIAIGTSLPEISTAITAALKKEGEIAVGNIIGADILNILWIIGVSSIVKPISVDLKVINFTFPYMILIVVVMLVSMRLGCRLGKAKGLILLILYGLYLGLTLKFFG